MGVFILFQAFLGHHDIFFQIILERDWKDRDPHEEHYWLVRLENPASAQERKQLRKGDESCQSFDFDGKVPGMSS